MLQTPIEPTAHLPTQGVHYVCASAQDVGQRLDNFLLRELKGVPKSRIYRIVRRGEVRLNGHRTQPEARLAEGDVLRIPPLRQSAPKPAIQPSKALIQQLDRAILHEDREILVLDKPAGLAVHKGSGIEYGVIEVLRAARPDQPYLELAHRLDRETSGCLVLAKSAVALKQVQEAFRDGRVDKRYLALVRGHWNLGIKTIEQPIGQADGPAYAGKMAVMTGGKVAISRFRPVHLRKAASVLEVRIETGRTHQIRVHAAHVGHPIAGDALYGDPIFNREMAQRGLRRLFLHAHSVILPVGGREIAISAPLPPELKAFCE